MTFVNRKALHRSAHAALEYGWSLLPLRHKFPHPILKATGHTRTEGFEVKSSWKPLQSTPPTPRELNIWLSDSSVTGIGIITGEISGLWVLDIDAHPDAFALMQRFALKPQVQTPSGGFHLHLPWNGERLPTLNSKTQKLLPAGIDIRGSGGYAVLPPSINANGEYRQIRRLHPDALRDLSDLNTELLRHIMPPAPPPPPPPSAVLHHTREDTLLRFALERAEHGRNNAGFWLANRLRDKGLEHSAALQVMLSYQHAVQGERGGAYTAEEARSSLNSAYAR